MKQEDSKTITIVEIGLRRLTCSVCKETWDEEFDMNDMSGYDPVDGELIDCDKCGAGVLVKCEQY